jgi:hypothetical protein
MNWQMTDKADGVPALRRMWLALGYTQLVLIMVLAVMPLPVVVPAELLSDKVIHLLAFAFLMLWFASLFPRQQHWRVFSALLLYGLIMEAVQSQVPRRYAEGADLVADLIGLLVGLLLVRTSLHRWPLWVERMLGKNG